MKEPQRMFPECSCNLKRLGIPLMPKNVILVLVYGKEKLVFCCTNSSHTIQYEDMGAELKEAECVHLIIASASGLD